MAQIYIVQGWTGEYSDRNEWLVAAYEEEVVAEAVAQDLTALAKEASKSEVHWDWDKTAAGKLLQQKDPQASIDYTGTDYTVLSVNLITKQ